MGLIADVLRKTKSPNALAVKNDTLVVDREVNALEVVFIESPLILVPSHSVITLIHSGRACSRCGDVIKAYDSGLMKDMKRNLDGLKHERFLKGLDCDQCNIKWCSTKCKEQDVWHDGLTHRPINKSNTNQVGDVTIHWGEWVTLKKELGDPTKYGVFHCLLECEHDPNVRKLFESLSREESVNAAHWQKFAELVNKTFTKVNYSPDTIAKYAEIYERNNYDGSVYLIFSNIKREKGGGNSKIELFDKDQCKSFDEIDVNTHLIKHINTNVERMKPIYTNRATSMNKKMIQCKSIVGMAKGQALTIPSLNYTNPKDDDDDDVVYLEESGVPKIIIPHEPSTTRVKRRTSLTSSGASFGEGIIKYNRDQIREMLQTNVIEEHDDYFTDEDTSDDVGEDEIIQKIKELSVSVRRKSVRFVDS